MLKKIKFFIRDIFTIRNILKKDYYIMVGYEYSDNNEKIASCMYQLDTALTSKQIKELKWQIIKLIETEIQISIN